MFGVIHLVVHVSSVDECLCVVRMFMYVVCVGCCECVCLLCQVTFGVFKFQDVWHASCLQLVFLVIVFHFSCFRVFCFCFFVSLFVVLFRPLFFEIFCSCLSLLS